MAGVFAVKAQAIVDDCERARIAFDKWIAEQRSSMDALQTQDSINVQENQETLATLNKRREEAMKETETHLKETARKERALQETTNMIAQLESTATEAETKRDELADCVLQEKTSLQQHILALTEAENARDERIATLTKGVEYYTERLGLRFARLEDQSLRFVFVNIDPLDFSREFYFAVRIGEGKVYELSECVPSVAGAESHVQNLNENNDLSQFVRAMRQEFRSSVSRN